jgi:hypothetical protein
MPLPPGVAEKIRAHKYGQRRLTSPASLQQYNKAMRLGSEGRGPLKQRVATDATVTTILGQMNTKLNAALVAAGGSAPGEPIIKLAAPDEMFIPKNVWLGRIDLKTGGMTEAQRSNFQDAEKDFADQAGLLRRRIAELFALEKVENDLGNAGEKPNPGGVVDGIR